MKKFRKAALALVLAGSALAGCDLLGKNDPKGKDEEQQQQQQEQQQQGEQQQEQQNVAVTGVSLGAQAITLKVGDERVLTAEVAPANATNKAVTWSTSEATVASVENGRVVALAEGTAVITVTTADGGKTATVTVTVEPVVPDEVRVTGISLNKTTTEILEGTAETLVATVMPADATHPEYTWSSSDDTVATVNNGVVTAVKGGTATIKVVTTEGGFQASCVVTVKEIQRHFKHEVLTGDEPLEINEVGFTLDGEAVDGDIVHVEEEDGKTLVYGIKGGVVTLVKGEFSHEIKVCYSINTITKGASISGLQTRFAEKFSRLNAEADKFTVGNKNKLYPDFTVRYDTWKLEGDEWVEDDSEDVKLEDLDDYFTEETKPVITVKDHADYLTVNDDLSVMFTEAALNKEVELEVKSGVLKDSVTFTVKEGYNAHSHSEFKSLYENTALSGTIYLVRGFNAELSQDRFYFDETNQGLYPNNLWEDEHSKTKSGSVYDRHFNAGEQPNTLEVNGNYLTIDGRNVPGHASTTDPGQRGNITGTEVPNNGEGMFFITSQMDSPAKLVIKNLTISGNADRSPSAADNLDGSEGLAGICANRTQIELISSNIDHVERGIFSMNGHTEVVFAHQGVDMKKSSIVDVWGPAIDAYEGKAVNLRNSYITRCGGPAIWNYGSDGPDYAKTTISWDEATVFENWIPANTPWCIANHVDVSGSLQSIEDNVSAWGTIFNQSMFNFVCLCMANTDRTGANTWKDITVVDSQEQTIIHANEQPTRFTGGTAGMIAGGVYAAAGAYICGMGQTDGAMDEVAGPMIPGLIGSGVPEGKAPMAAWQLAIQQYCQNEITAGRQAILDVTAYIPNAGFLCAFCEVVNKA